MFIYLCAFLKNLRERKPSYKNIWTKVSYYILSQLSLCIFKCIKISGAKVIYYIMSQLSLCIFFKRIKNVWAKSRLLFYASRCNIWMKVVCVFYYAFRRIGIYEETLLGCFVGFFLCVKYLHKKINCLNNLIFTILLLTLLMSIKNWI